jgi:hypothetical protein
MIPFLAYLSTGFVRYPDFALAFSCPFGATTRRFDPQTLASRVSSIGSVFSASIWRFGDSPHRSASRGNSVVLRLLTGGLLVRIQPEEPNS